jgi:hypothetical protein
VSVGWFHRAFDRINVTTRFCFSFHSRCVNCGSASVRPVKGRDYIDPKSRSPLSFLQAPLGASLKRCSLCRLQFWDLRPVASSAIPETGATSDAPSLSSDLRP